MEKLDFTVTGITPMLLNNPRCVDPFDKYAIARKEITGKRKKTDDDLRALRLLDIESKIYWDDEHGIYIPATWISASIAGVSWSLCKIKKADIRACVFPTQSRIKLNYRGEKNVKTPDDITRNPDYSHTMLLKQNAVRIAKAAPIFHDWSFTTSVEFDRSKINPSELKSMIDQASCYAGYGDFRPSYGRAQVVFH